jgi:hypothetical protein
MDIGKYIDESVARLKQQTAKHKKDWNLGAEDSWSVDQAKGQITFIFPDGQIVKAKVQIVGTYNRPDETFLWSWDHPSVIKSLSVDARKVKEFGDEHGDRRFSERKVLCSEIDAWAFTAVAANLAEADGAYRVEAGGPLLYMTFTDIDVMEGEDDYLSSETRVGQAPSVEVVEEPELLTFLKKYFQEMYVIERDCHEQILGSDQPSAEIQKESIARKNQVYNRYWRRVDEKWVPASVSWPSDYDPDRVGNWQVFKLGDQDYRVCYVLSEYSSEFEYSYDLREFADGYRIVDRHFD